MRAVLVGMIERETLLQMDAGGNQLPRAVQGRAQGPIGFQEQRRVPLPLGQHKELLAHLAGGLYLRPHKIQPPQTKQRWDELRGLADLVTQLARPGIGLRHLGSRIALGGHQHGSQGKLEVELLLCTLGSLRQCREQLQPRGEMAERFQIRRALAGPLTRRLPVADGLCARPASV